MSTREFVNNRSSNPNSPHLTLYKIIRTVMLAGFAIFIILLAFLFTETSIGTVIQNVLKWLFAVNTVQLWWYVTRAAGIMSYLLLWFSTAWGLAVASKIFDRFLQGKYTYDFHQFISLLAVGFLFVHIAVILLDRYLPFSIAQVLVPFIAPYRPVWVGVGIIAFYLTLLVTVTFYMRQRIGMRTFRSIHLLSFFAYLGATVHGLYAGTDSVLPAMKLIYEGTFLSIVFLTVYWLVIVSPKKRLNPESRAVAAVRVENRPGGPRR
jgi:predicted ferric reductase